MKIIITDTRPVTSTLANEYVEYLRSQGNTEEEIKNALDDDYSKYGVRVEYIFSE